VQERDLVKARYVLRHIGEMEAGESDHFSLVLAGSGMGVGVFLAGPGRRSPYCASSEAGERCERTEAARFFPDGPSSAQARVGRSWPGSSPGRTSRMSRTSRMRSPSRLFRLHR
jgi:hypothetical protein